MPQGVYLVVFRVASQRYALRASGVDRIVRAVAVTPLPDAPDIVSGVIDVGGSVVPVISLRRRFGVPERDLDPAQHFILARTRKRRVALIVDEVDDVARIAESSIVEARRVMPGVGQVDGVVQMDDGLVLIHDLDQCLSIEDERSLAAAMTEHVARDA